MKKRTLMLILGALMQLSLSAQTKSPEKDTTVAYTITLDQPVQVDAAPFSKTRCGGGGCGGGCGWGHPVSVNKRIITQAEAGAMFTKTNTAFLAAIYVGVPLGKGFVVGSRNLFSKGLIAPTVVASFSRQLYKNLGFTVFTGPGMAFLSQNSRAVGRNGNVNQLDRRSAFAVDGGLKLYYRVYNSISVSVTAGTLFYTGNNMLPYVTTGIAIWPKLSNKDRRSCCFEGKKQKE